MLSYNDIKLYSYFTTFDYTRLLHQASDWLSLTWKQSELFEQKLVSAKSFQPE